MTRGALPNEDARVRPEDDCEVPPPWTKELVRGSADLWFRWPVQELVARNRFPNKLASDAAAP